MIRKIDYLIDSENDGVKTSVYLKKRGFSGTIIKMLKSGDYIFINGIESPANSVLHTGDMLSVTVKEDTPSEFVIADNTPIKVIFEDDDILIVDKPAGMAVHPSHGNHLGTLASAFASHCPDTVFRCINRLDKNTSGLVLIAKNKLSAAILTEMLAERKIHREYFAICEGVLPERGTINAPIARAEGSTLERCVDEHGAPAVTHYIRLSCGIKYSAAAITLDTGRTHQIRVHFKHIGHPLPGDFIYNPDYEIIKRTALHSRKLSFPHPITGEEMSFTAPLPDDLTEPALLAGFKE